jgi:site-specific recombinase
MFSLLSAIVLLACLIAPPVAEGFHTPLLPVKRHSVTTPRHDGIDPALLNAGKDVIISVANLVPIVVVIYFSKENKGTDIALVELKAEVKSGMKELVAKIEAKIDEKIDETNSKIDETNSKIDKSFRELKTLITRQSDEMNSNTDETNLKFDKRFRAVDATMNQLCDVNSSLQDEMQETRKKVHHIIERLNLIESIQDNKIPKEEIVQDETAKNSTGAGSKRSN